MEPKERTVKTLETAEGRCPFAEWFDALRDKKAIAIIASRVNRARFGNFGDWKAIGEGVNEMRIDFGPGYRVYYTLHEDTIIVLLLGGDKSTQEKDIQRAIALWKESKDETKRFQRDF